MLCFRFSALGLRVVGSLSSGFASHPEPNFDTFEYIHVGSISRMPNSFVSVIVEVGLLGFVLRILPLTICSASG